MADEKKYTVEELDEMMDALGAALEVLKAFDEYEAYEKDARCDEARQERLRFAVEDTDKYLWSEAWDDDADFCASFGTCMAVHRQKFLANAKDDAGTPEWMACGRFIHENEDGTLDWDMFGQIDYMSEWCASIEKTFDEAGADVSLEQIMATAWAITMTLWDAKEVIPRVGKAAFVTRIGKAVNTYIGAIARVLG